MAVIMNTVKRTLSVSIARGQDANGNSVSKSYVYSNVKPDAEPAKLAAVGKALGGLFDNEITGLTVVGALAPINPGSTGGRQKTL